MYEILEDLFMEERQRNIYENYIRICSYSSVQLLVFKMKFHLTLDVSLYVPPLRFIYLRQ